MVAALNHAFRAFDAAQEKSIMHICEEIRQDPFIFDSDMDLDPSYDRGDALVEAIPKPSIEDPHYFKLATKSMIPLCQGYEFNRLIGTSMILNTCATHRCTNGFVDELFSLLQNSILPKPNNLPKSHYEVKCLIQNLGLRYIQSICVKMVVFYIAKNML